MPTIQNILHIQGGGAKAAALLDFIADRRYGRGSIDFNRITPMPPWVYRQPTHQELLRQCGDGSERPAPGAMDQAVRRWRNHPLRHRGQRCAGADPKALAGV